MGLFYCKKIKATQVGNSKNINKVSYYRCKHEKNDKKNQMIMPIKNIDNRSKYPYTKDGK